MALAAQPTADGSAVRVCVPPTRSDVLHACDVIEVRVETSVLSVLNSIFRHFNASHSCVESERKQYQCRGLGRVGEGTRELHAVLNHAPDPQNP
jgi:phenylalanyl-tRNA synthetase beta subunit